MSELFVSDPSLPNSPEDIYQDYLRRFYPDLVGVRPLFLFKEKATLQDERPIIGKVSKVNPVIETIFKHLQPNEDPVMFIFTIGWDAWNVASRAVREAWIDQLMAQCGAEEDEKSGEMKYKIRPPTISVFPEVIRRHGTDWDSAVAKLATLSEAEGVSLHKGDVSELMADEGFFGADDSEG